MRKDIKYLLKNNFNKYKEVGKKNSFLLLPHKQKQ